MLLLNVGSQQLPEIIKLVDIHLFLYVQIDIRVQFKIESELMVKCFDK